MSRRKRPKTGPCVYCGQIRPITEDHVPPKNLFAVPRPSNLIKVPSCRECHSENKQVSKDDEYFRLKVILREDTADHPEVKQVLPTVLRSLAKPEKVGFAQALFKSIREVDLVTPSGLFVNRKWAHDVDFRRLNSVAERITKGLFYHEKGVRLPDEYEMLVVCSESGLRATEEGKNKLKRIFQGVLANTPKTVGKEVFSYRVAFTGTDPNASAWLLIFYKRVLFFCWTLPREA